MHRNIFTEHGTVKRQPYILNKIEFEKFTNACKEEECGLLFLMYYATNIPPHKLVHLKYMQVDFFEDTLRMDDISIKINEKVKAIVSKQFERQAHLKLHSPYVFARADGLIWRNASYLYRFDKIKKKCGLDQIQILDIPYNAFIRELNKGTGIKTMEQYYYNIRGNSLWHRALTYMERMRQEPLNIENYEERTYNIPENGCEKRSCGATRV